MSAVRRAHRRCAVTGAPTPSFQANTDARLPGTGGYGVQAFVPLHAQSSTSPPVANRRFQAGSDGPSRPPHISHYSPARSRHAATRSDDAATNRSFPSSTSHNRRLAAPLRRCGRGHGGSIWRSCEERVMFWEPAGKRARQAERTDQANRSGRSATGRPAKPPGNSIG